MFYHLLTVYSVIVAIPLSHIGLLHVHHVATPGVVIATYLRSQSDRSFVFLIKLSCQILQSLPPASPSVIHVHNNFIAIRWHT